jgi:hypothetical protein
MNESTKSDSGNNGILMEQYKVRCQEMLVMVPLYKTHVRNFQIIAGAILGATAFAMSRPDSLPWGLLWACAAFLPVVTTYLLLDILYTTYTMQMVAEGIANIEERLNRNLGSCLFTWESLVSEMFFQWRSPIPGVVNPGWFVGAFGLFIYFMMTLVVPVVACIWTVSTSLDASCWFKALIILSFLIPIVFCMAVVAYTARALGGMRSVVKDWMTKEIKKKNNEMANASAE